jgi:hypothetical protein
MMERALLCSVFQEGEAAVAQTNDIHSVFLALERRMSDA